METKKRSFSLPFLSNLFRHSYTEWAALLLFILLPFIVALLSGQSFAGLVRNQGGTPKFVEGLAIEVFILAAFAISYDLILGITGLLSFGHAMFFASGAYVTGILLKSFGWSLLPTLGMVILVGVVQALLFAIVLPRVKGVTFALVTLGISSVFYILIQSTELNPFTGGDVGLQGVVTPDIINSTAHRMRFYFLALAFITLVYILYKRFVDSPTGRVCIAGRENEMRARMLGYNTFWFKLIALILASVTAAMAGYLFALFQPIVSPYNASMSFTIAAILMTLIGGIGTLSGALVGAFIYRMLDYVLTTWFTQRSIFLLGVIYILIVLFLPYGIIGTLRMQSLQIRSGWNRLIRIFSGKQPTQEQ